MTGITGEYGGTGRRTESNMMEEPGRGLPRTESGRGNIGVRIEYMSHPLRIIVAPTSINLSTLRLAELGDALAVRSVGASPALRLLHPGCMLCRCVVYRRCLASTALIPSGGGSSLLGAGRLSNFAFRLKLWPGTQKHKGLDSLVPFTCEKRF